MDNESAKCMNYLMHNAPKWPDTLKILQQMLQNFQSVSDHFRTLCIKGLSCSLFQTPVT